MLSIREQTVLQGKASMLMHLLHHRFDQVPTATEQRIFQADEARLDTWSERIFNSRTLDEVLADS